MVYEAAALVKNTRMVYERHECVGIHCSEVRVVAYALLTQSFLVVARIRLGIPMSQGVAEFSESEFERVTTPTGSSIPRGFGS